MKSSTKWILGISALILLLIAGIYYFTQQTAIGGCGESWASADKSCSSVEECKVSEIDTSELEIRCNNNLCEVKLPDCVEAS